MTDPGIDLDRLADLVADKVAARLNDRHADERLTWTCAQVAAAICRSQDYVRDHRHELGVLPATGTRPRLLFDPDRVRAWATVRPATKPATRPEPRPQRRQLSARTPRPDLLPVRGLDGKEAA